MTDRDRSFTGPPSILDHDLNKYFPELRKFESTQEMESSELYKSIRTDVERIMNAVVVEHTATPSPVKNQQIRSLAWNLERGIQLDGIIDALSSHPELTIKDVLLLTELDHGMARSGNRFVAQEIARALNLNYAFAPVYIPLQKGSGVEAEMEGENTTSIHGLALFSPHHLSNVHAVPLPNGKDKMWVK